MLLSQHNLPEQNEVDWLYATIRQAVEDAIKNTRTASPHSQSDEVLDIHGVAKLLTVEGGRNLRGETIAKLTKKGIIPGTFLGMGLGWRYSKNAVLKALSRQTTQETE